jgi:hypothetical protein
MHKLKELFTNYKGRLSTSKTFFVVFATIISLRVLLLGTKEITYEVVALLLGFLGYKGVKVWKMNS